MSEMDVVSDYFGHWLYSDTDPVEGETESPWAGEPEAERVSEPEAAGEPGE